MKSAVDLLQATEAHARKILREDMDPNYQYHSPEHTFQVVEMVREIGLKCQLKEDEILILQLAGWMHDIGYVKVYEGHEQVSMEMARDFLTEQGADESLIEAVVALIEATRLGHEPRNALEKVIKDSDLFNLATPDALVNSEKIRWEWKYFCHREFSDEDWDSFNLNFFDNHEYYTEYARDNFEPVKQEHIKKLRKRIKKRGKKQEESDRSVLEYQLDEKDVELERLKRKLKKIKKQRPDRGIETMFRTTYRTHINLSDLADSKANILLSINAIIISIIFSSTIEKGIGLDDNYLLVPNMMILAVCMTTIVFAILATRPKVSSGKFERKDILDKKTNLLFFGNFYKMEMDDYMWGINEMMTDANYLYGSMTKDIFFLGKVLAQKFSLLRWAYNIFMYGLGVSVLVYAISIIMRP
ncbi:MAG: DUF5706 domain-containing protein [Bacteroidia bacterium]|nr:DUF5706 domain-containing protein [Bacteroidia bacterium]